MIINNLNDRYSVRIGVVTNYAYLFLIKKSRLKFINIGELLASASDLGITI
jgi:hypothetical protein